MIIWDFPDEPPDTLERVLCWQSYAYGNTLSSVPRYLEDHAARLREKYLAFIYDLGEKRINGKRVVDHLDVGDGFSLWWMTQLAEKSPFKSPNIYNCLRLLALEEIIQLEEVSSITLNSHDRILARAIQGLCNHLQIRFVWLSGGGTKARKSFDVCSIRDVFPHVLRGLLSLSSLRKPWIFQKLSKPKWFSGEGAIFCCSYFFNWDISAAELGEYYARQWEGLPKHLQSTGHRLNWIHHFINAPGMSNARVGMKWLESFNQDADGQGLHAFLGTYLSIRVVFRALRKWGRLVSRSWRLRGIKCVFTPENSVVCLWPLLERDWKTSVMGSVAMKNCLWVELFLELFKSMPHQKLGIYLWENQGWESAMIHAWRHCGHGKIIGIPHATIAFWHLNNFDDARALKRGDAYAKPLPDLLAVNGPMAYNAFVQAGYAMQRLAEVEASRFQYLLDRCWDQREIRVDNNGMATGKKVLILGDFTKKQTKAMLKCTEQALLLSDVEISLTVKFHPVAPLSVDECPISSFEITEKPLGDIMKDFDLAFVSGTTSAGLDALLGGLSVAVYLDGSDFNCSPIRGFDDVRFISSPEELAVFFRMARRNNSPPAAGEYFWLDKNFFRWNQVIANVG